MRALFTILTILLMTPALFPLHGKTKPHDLTSDYLMRKADDPQVAWQTRVACLDSLIKTRRLDMPTLAELYFKKATLLENENRFTEALQTYRDAAKAISGDMPSQYCRLLREKARMCVYTRSYIEGLECASSLALFTKPDSLEKYTFYGHMLLVDLFRSLRNTVTIRKGATTTTVCGVCHATPRCSTTASPPYTAMMPCYAWTPEISRVCGTTS